MTIVMDEIQKKYFSTLCDVKNITKASESLYISRQALSSSIKKMEDELGVPLFIRKKEGVALTEYGEMLFKALADQDAIWQKMLRRMQEKKQAEKMIIRVAMGGVTIPSAQYNNILAFEKTHPNVSIEFVSDDLDKNLQGLRNGEIDLVRSIYTEESPDYFRIRLESDPLVRQNCLIISKNSPLAQLEEIDFMKDLRGQTLLYEGNYLPEEFRALCRKLGIRNQSISAGCEVIAGMIGWDRACLYMPAKYCHRFMNDMVCTRPLTNLPLSIESYILYRHDIPQMTRELIHYIICQYNGGNDILLPDEQA